MCVCVCVCVRACVCVSVHVWMHVHVHVCARILMSWVTSVQQKFQESSEVFRRQSCQAFTSLSIFDLNTVICFWNGINDPPLALEDDGL
jgi:hypothetical protein